MQQEQSSNHPSPDAEFDGEFTGEDFVIPRWRIDKNSGQFINSVTGATRDTLIAIVLRIGRSRIFWGKFKGKDTELLCYSNDGIMPADQNTPYGNMVEDFNEHGKTKICDGCAMAQWDDKKRPECSQIFNYLLLEPSSSVPSVLSMSRMRAKTARELNTLVKFCGVKSWIEFSTFLQSHPSGDFQQIQIKESYHNDEWLEHARQVLKTKMLKLTSPEQPGQGNDTEPAIDAETGEVL